MNIEMEIRLIIAQLTELPKKDRLAITELLEHSEWGIALEHLCAAIVEERIQISKKIGQRVESIAQEMDMWNDIREQLKDFYSTNGERLFPQ